VIQMRSETRAIVLLLAVVLVASCAPSTPTGSPTGPAVTASGSVLPSLTPSPSEVRSETASETVPPLTAEAIQVTWTRTVTTKQWGDKPFKVLATASNGAHIAYSAEGGCDIGKSNGTVRINNAGSCVITATAATSDPPATASLSFEIAPAHPVIKFGKDSTRFQRDMRLALSATTDPEIDLSYAVVHGAKGSAHDEECAIDGSSLVWAHLPTLDRFPSLDAFCMVKVTAARSSKNYVAPDPV
jgi:hypothetical protein